MPAALRDRLRKLQGEGLPAGSPASYLFAVACVAAAGLAHFAFASFISDLTPSIPYYPAIFVAALFGGIRAGIAAVVLSAVAVWWAVDTHYFGHNVAALTQAVNRGLFIASAVVIVWVAESYRRGGPGQEQAAASPAAIDAPATSGPHRWWHRRPRPNSPAAYGFALSCVAAPTLVRFAVGWLGGDVLPFASYFPAILIASLIGGAEAGLFAMILSLVVAWWAFLPRHVTPGLPTRDEFVSFALYLFASLLTVWLAESYRRVLRRLHAQEAPLVEFIAPVVASLAAVLLTTVILFMIDSYLAPQHLVLGYLLPTVIIAIYYGSTFAVLTSFASGLAAAYILFPPKFSFYVASPLHLAELGFFMLLAAIASKAVSVLTDDIRARKRSSFRNRL
jgi:K+-sensing histidine kinase KdpD